MSKYYYIEPKISGELGDKAIIDTSEFPPLIIILRNYLK